MDDITGTETEDQFGKPDDEWNDWVDNNNLLISFNYWPKNGHLVWQDMITNAVTMVVPSLVSTIAHLLLKYRKKERSLYRAIMEKYDLFRKHTFSYQVRQNLLRVQRLHREGELQEHPLLGPNIFLSPKQCRRCGRMEELPENVGTEIYHWGSQCPYSDGQGNIQKVRSSSFSDHDISQRSFERYLEEEAKSLGITIKDISRSGTKQDWMYRTAKQCENKARKGVYPLFCPYVRARSIQLFEAGQHLVGKGKDLVMESDLHWQGWYMKYHDHKTTVGKEAQRKVKALSLIHI